MGVINGALNLLFGNGRNVVSETARIFRPHAEAADAREMAYRTAALQEFASEFVVPRKGFFDRFMDGLNRVPRPALAFGTIGLFISAMTDPVWFAARMQGVALVPEPLWWLMGAIVSFYFGARHQVKGLEFQRSIAMTMASTPQVIENINALSQIGNPKDPDAVTTTPQPSLGYSSGTNAALDDWRQANGI